MGFFIGIGGFVNGIGDFGIGISGFVRWFCYWYG